MEACKKKKGHQKAKKKPLKEGVAFVAYWAAVFKEKSKRDRSISKGEKRKITKRRNSMIKRMDMFKKSLYKGCGKRKVNKSLCWE